MPITVCHISSTFISKAGSGRRTYRIIRAMSDAGFRVVNITGAAFEPSPDWDMSGIETINIPTLHKPVSPRQDLTAFVHLIQLLRSVKPDIVHTHLAKAGILGRLAARFCQVPCILHTVHGPTFPDSIGRKKVWLYRTLEKLAARSTNCFVFVGEELRQHYIESGVVDEEKTVVIRTGRPANELKVVDELPGADLEVCRNAWQVPEGAFVIASVGRLVPSKDQMRAIDALHALRERGVNAVLWLIGEAHLPEECSYRSKLIDHCAALGLTNHVRLVGFRSDVLIMMAAADVILMTSHFEGLPNVAVEAGIAARPFVGFRVSGLGEVIQDGVTGYVLGQTDMTGLIDRLDQLARDPIKRTAMGRAARQQVQDCFNAEVMVAAKLALYERMIRSTPLLNRHRPEKSLEAA